jgi:hypothetical protein
VVSAADHSVGEARVEVGKMRADRSRV